MKKNTLLLAAALCLACVHLFQVSYGQTSCNSPYAASQDTVYEITVDGEFWISFTPEQDSVFINLNPDDYHELDIFLYEGDCGDLTLIETYNGSGSHKVNNLVPSQNYYLMLDNPAPATVHFAIRNDLEHFFGRNNELYGTYGNFLTINSLIPNVDLEQACGPHFTFKLGVPGVSSLNHNPSWSARFIAFDDQSQSIHTASVDPQNQQVDLDGFYPAVGPGKYSVTLEINYADGNGYVCAYERSDGTCPVFYLEVHDDVPVLDFSLIPDRICPDGSVFIVFNHQNVIGTKYSINPNYDTQPPGNLQDLPYDDFSGAGFEYEPLKVGAFRQQYANSILPGIHSIDITAENACGVKEQTRDFEVGLDIDFIADDVCFGEPVAFQAIDYCDPSDYFHQHDGIEYESTWKWDFGDGNIATYAYNNQHIPLIHHTYNSPGVYSVSLTATMKNPVDNSVVTTNTVTKDVEVYLTPEVPAVSGHFNDCDDPEKEYTIDNYNSSYNYTISVDPPGAGSVTYSGGNTFFVEWDFSGITYSPPLVELHVEAFGPEGCQSASVDTVFECCEKPEVFALNNAVYSQLPQSMKDQLASVPPAEDFIVNGTFLLDEDITVEQASFLCGPDVVFQVADGVSVKFIDVTINQHCDYMWKGIFVTSSDASITLTECTLSNARSAVYSSNGGDFTISGTSINSSYRGIVVASNKPPGFLWDPLIPHPGSIDSSEITGLESLPYPPHENSESYAGVDAHTVYGLTIGNPSNPGSKNTFTDVFLGIKAINSYIEVYNNAFIRSQPVLYNGGFAQPTNPMTSTAIFSSYDKSFTFGRGVPRKLVVSGNHSGQNANTISGYGFGIHAHNLAADIRSNTFNQLHSAVRFFEPRTESRVIDNQVGGQEDYIPHGIWVQAAQKTNVDISVSNNEIFAEHTGIHFFNLRSYENPDDGVSYQVRANSNSIRFAPENYNHNRYGIRLISSDRVRVHLNEVTRGTDSNPPEDFRRMYGISLAASRLGDVYGNAPLRNLGAGIRIAGNCNFTQFVCNEIDDSKYGILFDYMASITQNGSETRPTANRWFPVGHYDHGIQCRKMNKMPLGVINLANILYTPWYVAYGQLGSQSATDPEIVIGHNLYNYIYPMESDQYVEFVCPVDPFFDPHGLEELRDEYFSLMVEQGHDYDHLEELYQYYDARFLYGVLRDAPDLVDIGSIEDDHFQAFYDSIQQTVIEDLEDIQDLLEDDDINEAILMNEALDISQDWILDLQRVNRVYLNKFIRGNYEYTPEELDLLWEIALTNPHEGGEAVFVARAMLGVDPDDYEVVFYEATEEPEDDRSDETSRVVVYPNPASDQIYVRITGEPLEETVISQLYDVNGRLIMTQSHGSSSFFSIPVDQLNSGLYFLKVTDHDQIMETIKVIIR